MTNLEKVDLDQAVRKARQNNFVEKQCCRDNVIGTLGRQCNRHFGHVIA